MPKVKEPRRLFIPVHATRKLPRVYFTDAAELYSIYPIADGWHAKVFDSRSKMTPGGTD